MKNNTPQDFQMLFSEVTAKYLSKELRIEQVFASKPFGEVTEAMVSHLKQDHPGMEGLMGYAKQHEFDLTAVRGIWIAAGVCAALKGPRQKDYILWAGGLASNQLVAEGFSPLIDDMKMAFQRVNAGSQHVLHSTFSKPFKKSLQALMEKTSRPIEPLLRSVRTAQEETTPAVVQRTSDEYSSVFQTIKSRVEGQGPNAEIVVKDAGFKEMVETIFNDFSREHPGIESMVAFARKSEVPTGTIKGIWNALGVAAATEGPRQAHWINKAGTYATWANENSDNDESGLFLMLLRFMKEGFDKSSDPDQIERLKSQSSGLGDFLDKIQAPVVEREPQPSHSPSDQTLGR